MEKSEVLKVRMFGGFMLTYKGEKIQIGKKQTTKAIQMLQVLLHAGESGVTRNQLLECTFGRDIEGDLSNNLSVTVYHLRKLLKESKLPEEKYICIKGGRYRFKSSYPVEVDALLFEQLIRESRTCAKEQRIPVLKKACELYEGPFLPALAGEEWAIVAGAHYQYLYFDCLEEVCVYLKEQREYEELLKLSSFAVSLYPFDEWQIWQMEAMLAMKQYKEALTLYENTTKMYFEELAAPPSERMTAFFQRMSSQVQLEVSSFQEIQMDLKEEAGQNGAYYCPYPSFIDSYHMAVRIMERSGQSIYLMLCTIHDERKQVTENLERLKVISDKLAESIQIALRRGDIFTRYNMSQFLVILMGIRQEECPIAVSRIDACFRQRESSRRVHVTYRTASIACVEDDGEEIHFL